MVAEWAQLGEDSKNLILVVLEMLTWVAYHQDKGTAARGDIFRSTRTRRSRNLTSTLADQIFCNNTIKGNVDRQGFCTRSRNGGDQLLYDWLIF